MNKPSAVPALKPPLKWAGGKRWLVPKLAQLWQGHQHRRLVEPFCGGLAVSLGLLPERALLNDINRALINFYAQLQQGFQISLPMHNEAEHYYACRLQFNTLNLQDHTAKTCAELFYYLNRTGYNGLCRFNQRGQFNVPFGRYRSIAYQTDFRAYQTLLSNWQFSQVDFADLPLEASDFIYADPPYDVEFRQYAQAGFSWEDQVRLAEWLAAHPGPVALSNQATARIITLYRRLGFRIHRLQAPRSISCKGSRRQPAQEVLALRGF